MSAVFAALLVLIPAQGVRPYPWMHPQAPASRTAFWVTALSASAGINGHWQHAKRPVYVRDHGRPDGYNRTPTPRLEDGAPLAKGKDRTPR